MVLYVPGGGNEVGGDLASTTTTCTQHNLHVSFTTDFQYLGRLLTATDDDWPAVAGNIKKSQGVWGRLARVLGREGADPKVSHNFYTAVTQQVLLFGVET